MFVCIVQSWRGVVIETSKAPIVAFITNLKRRLIGP